MSGKRRRRKARAPRKDRPSSNPSQPTRPKSPRRVFAAIGAVGGALAAFAVASVVAWLAVPRAGMGRTVIVTWPSGASRGEGATILANAGVVDRPWLFRTLLTITAPFVTPVPGLHVFTDNLTPGEALRRLARLASRARAKVVIPEGFNRFQVSERLEELAVCSRSAFDAAASDHDALSTLGIAGDSAEGYLFPATYDLFEDGDPVAIVAELTAETKKRLATLHDRHAADFARVAAKYGWGERDVLTLASVVEKEAARADEQPLIASVFYNRLDDADFRPVRTLQSDPTAAYGCLVVPGLTSCSGYAGRVTPPMLRDPLNGYNTYRHPGLPPGPIANPGTGAVEAVLAPATTDYLFFVRSGDGRHTFTRTFQEHQAAMARGK